MASPMGGGREGAVVLCSLGDASITEGEVAEAFQMAALRQLPILYLVQDNDWDISAHAREPVICRSAWYIAAVKKMSPAYIMATNRRLFDSDEVLDSVADDANHCGVRLRQ